MRGDKFLVIGFDELPVDLCRLEAVLFQDFSSCEKRETKDDEDQHE